MDANFELTGGQVHIWLLELQAPADEALRARYAGLLDPDERARLDRFAFSHLRDEYLVSHALTRLLLSRYERVPPNALDLVRNRFGRPALSASRQGLRFSLSHATTVGALAVTCSGEIGVDLEPLDRQLATMTIAQHYFAPSEIEWLRRQSVDRQQQCFMELWTLKEAYTKARGLGLSLALDQFAIDLAGSEQPRIRFHDEADDPDDWHLATYSAIENHVLSLAVKVNAAIRLRVDLFDAVAA